jgi:uroporphyrin-3 C-methyltransferase
MLRLAEARAIARQSQETAVATEAKLALAEAKLAEMQSQSQALQAMLQELAGGRDERLLAEVEQTVTLAIQQLQYAGNVESALLALENAQARLARASSAQFVPVRRLLERDIERLKASSGANIGSLSLKIESVVAAADTLPLAFEQRPRAAATKPVAEARPGKPGDSSWRESGAALWREFWQELRQDMGQLIRIERVDQSDQALLSPTQGFFLRENLKLRLLSARLALLQRDGKTFHEEMRQTQVLLDRYFDGHAKPVMAVQSVVRELAAADMAFNLPALTETLAAVRNLKLAHERGAGRQGR